MSLARHSTNTPLARYTSKPLRDEEVTVVPIDPYDGCMLSYRFERVKLSEFMPQYMLLQFAFFDKGSSSTRAYLRDADDTAAGESGNRIYPVFLTDFADMLPYMVNGKISGKFCAQQRGNSYGIRLCLATPLEQLALSTLDSNNNEDE